jgi:hypothetical protein
MPVKLDDNTQFGRVGNANGTSPIAAGAINDGLAPLVDNQGRLITVPYVGGSIISGQALFLDSQAIVPWLALWPFANGKLISAFGSQSSGIQLWLQIFNLLAGPPGGAVIPYVSPIVVPNNGSWSFTFPEGGITFTNGILIAYSTTQATYTAPAVGGWISGFVR